MDTEMPVTAKTPWAGHTEGIPLHLEYQDNMMVDAVEEIVKKYPNYIAFDFMGKKTTYKEFFAGIEKCARALKTIGIRPGDRVTIALPNCPQGLYMFYAVNMVGGICNMIHPLSAEKEIEFYLNESESVTAVTLDQFYSKFERIRANTKVVNIIIASIKDELAPTLKAGYMLTEAMTKERIPEDAPVIRWEDFMKISKFCYGNYRVHRDSRDTAVILYSGGTTGTPKGIEHSNYAFNAVARQIVVSNPMFRPGDKMLAALPMFHGFGLGVCIHAMMTHGGRCILIPRFTPESYAKQMVKERCNLIAGVPTLFESMLRNPAMKNADLSCLKGVYSGGDSLSVELKKKLDHWLYDHNAAIQVREGYGAAEIITACCLTPPNMFKPGSIGVPFPDNYIKIVEPDTDKELPYGQLGEILLSGPALMKGYMHHPEETERSLRKHADGLTWLYTGDLGSMDSEGFVYFKGRAKRMIVTRGYNVYPAQLENIIDGSEMVRMSCVIGVPDPVKMQKIKVFVELEPEFKPTKETEEAIMVHCRRNIAKYALPYAIEFREKLPQTLVGKVDYHKLEEEEQAVLRGELKPQGITAAEEVPRRKKWFFF